MKFKSKKWGWIGQTFRKDPNNVARKALKYNPQGRGKPGRPKSNWMEVHVSSVDQGGDLLASPSP